MTERYTIRRFRPPDLEGYLSLYDDVFGWQPDEEWFQWKYRNNPYADHVPIYVAEANGEIVGARSFFALPLRTGHSTVRALQPCDTMVHEAHRRQGLFTRLTEAAIEAYRDGVPALCFNFPNSKTRAGNRKLGWRVVAERESYYRIHDPAAIAGSTGDGGLVDRALNAASPIATGYLAACNAFPDGGSTGPGVSIRRHETIPAARVESLYCERVPDGFHVPRDERFLRWRVRKPDWEYRAYLATVGDRDVAAMITGTDHSPELTRTMILDVTAGDGGSTAVRERLLTAVLEDNRGADLVVASADSISRGALLRRGFLPDGKPPLSPVTETTTLMARPLSTDDNWTLGGKAIDDGGNWATTSLSYDRN